MHYGSQGDQALEQINFLRNRINENRRRQKLSALCDGVRPL
jgi:hypothetical protein